MKEGDIVVMKEDFCNYWKKGDSARLIYKLNDSMNNDWLADFSINDDYYEDGLWCISTMDVL